MPVIDLSLPIRQAVVAHLRADASLTALVQSTRIYGEFAPFDLDDGPFIRLGYQSATGFEASGWSGSENDLTIHAFAKGPGTDAIASICRRIVESMEAFDPAGFGLPESEWISTQVMPDEIPDALHGVVRYQVSAVMVD